MNRRTIDEHRDAVDALLAPLAENRASERLEVSAERLLARPGDYRGRILASDVLSPTDLPNFDNSQMDGYAVSWFDLVTASSAEPVSLLVAPQIAAGDEVTALRAGTAAPIMTGAPVPPGADAVVPIEQADPPRFQTSGSSESRSPTQGQSQTEGPTQSQSQIAGQPESQAEAESESQPTVSFDEPVTPGTYIRRTGSDVKAGEVLLPAGAVLGPAQLGVIAGTGLTVVDVLRRMRVLLISTGHEIRDAGTTLEPGQIFDSNSVSLSLALLDAGCEVTAVACRSDEADVLQGILDTHALATDLIVTIGGVSAGAREVVRDVFTPLGVEFGKVAMQPGGPQGFGLAALTQESSVITRPVLCLPGNPVSALISFEMFVRPALRRLAHKEPAERVREVAMIAEALDSPSGVHQIRRGFVHDDGTVQLIGGSSSHLLHSYANSNALVHVPAEVTHLDAGDPVMVWRIDE